MRGSCESGMRKPGHSLRAWADESRIRTGSWASQCTMSPGSRHEVSLQFPCHLSECCFRTPNPVRFFEIGAHDVCGRRFRCRGSASTAPKTKLCAIYSEGQRSALLGMHQKRQNVPRKPIVCYTQADGRERTTILRKERLPHRTNSDCHTRQAGHAAKRLHPFRKRNETAPPLPDKQNGPAAITSRRAESIGTRASQQAPLARCLVGQANLRTTPRGACDHLAAHARPGLAERLPEASGANPCPGRTAPGTPRAVRPTRG